MDAGDRTEPVDAMGRKGALTLANAGHLPPYLNGEPTAFEGSLPLGIIDMAEYSQITLPVAAGNVAVLMTDGIPEARNSRGILFGFNRVEELLRVNTSARSLAEAAQQFGQDDDLTVLRFVRIA
jgi:serine phosphatase RsbU (regulator of sigma subunit)